MGLVDEALRNYTPNVLDTSSSLVDEALSVKKKSSGAGDKMDLVDKALSSGVLPTKKKSFGAGRSFAPSFTDKAIEFLTAGHIPAVPISTESELTEEGELSKMFPEEGGKVGFFEDPVTFATMGGVAGARAAKPLAGKLLTAGREALGWMTGGASEVPALGKAGLKGLAKSVEIKNLERLGAKRAGKLFAEVPIEPGIKKGSLVEQALETTGKGISKEKEFADLIPEAPKPVELAPVAERVAHKYEIEIKDLREQVNTGQPGKRTQDAFGNPVVTNSTYPGWMQNKGWTKSEVLNSIDKGLEGKKLGVKQQEIFDTVKTEARSQFAEQIKLAQKEKIQPIKTNELNVGDRIKVKGETLKVTEKSPERIVIEDGQKYELDPYFDVIEGKKLTPAKTQLAPTSQEQIDQIPIRKTMPTLEETRRGKEVIKVEQPTPKALEPLVENIQKALQERPERLTHGYTSKNAFWIDAEGNIYQHNKYQDIPQKTNLINVHSHMPDNYKEYPNKRWDTFNASDVHSGLIWTAKQKVGNKTVVITSPNTVDILSTTKNTDPSFYRKGIKSLEKELHSTEIGKASSENDRERLRAFSDKYRLNYEENVPIQAKGIKVEPLAGQVKPIGEEIPEKTISQFTQEYKEGLLGEGGFIRLGGVEKVTPKVVTPSTKDVSLLEFPLTSLYVADQHPILAPIIKGNIKAEQNTNNWIFRYSDRVSQAFDKVERPLLFRTIFGRKGTAIRDIDLMIEGKKPIPTQLTGFVDDIKGVLGDVKGEVIQKMKNDFAESLSPKQKEYLDWVQGGKVGDKPKHVRAGTTKAVDEAFNQFKEMEKWGIQDYFPHIFKGKYKYLTEDGHIIASGQTAKQAKTNFEEYVESHPETTGNTFMFVNDFCDLLTVRIVLNPELTNPLEYLGTRLSRKEFFHLLGKTEKVIKEEIANAGVDDIPKVKVDMSGIASFQKGTKFSGHFLKRKTSLRGEETDPFRALMSYVFSVGRKLGLEDAKMASYSFADSLPKNMPNAKSYIKMQADLMSGRYNIVDKVFDETIGEKLGMKPFGVTRIFAKGVGLESKLKLGYAPAKTAINRIGGVFHTILQEGGKNYYEGKKLLKAKDPELIRRIQEEGHLAGMEQLFAGEGLIGVSEKQISWWRPLGTYQKAEVKNRSEALAAGYVAGLKKFGGDKDAAWIYAIDSTRLTQGLYNTAAKPVLVRGPVAQASYQFKQYLSNEIRFMSQLTPSQWAGYIAGITAVAGTRGALLTIKSIIGISIIGLGIDELMERLNRKAPRLHRGIFGLIGIDVSAPASWQIPSSIKDWVGVFPRDLWETGEMIIKGLKNKGWTDEQINDYVRQITPVGYNVFKGLQMLSEGVTKEGTKVIYRGGKEEGIINLTGARSVGQSQASDSARYMNQQRQLFLEKSKVLEDKLFGSKSAEEANNTFKELVELKNIQTPEEIQDFINGLRRSALSRQMTEEARIFMTLPRALKKEEIRRR